MRTQTATALISTILLIGVGTACAPRTSGLEARREADERFRRTTSVVNYDQAQQAFESGEIEKARKEIGSAIARSDKEARYWSLLGRIELEAKRLDRSLEAFAKAIECDPTLADPYYYRGIVHQRWSESAKAVEDYTKAAELAPDRVAYFLAAAEVMIAERRLDDARMLLLPKLAHFEHNAAMHELLGEISMLNQDYPSAARSYERALVIDAEAPLLAEKLVSAYFSAGEWQACLDAARRQRSLAARDTTGRRQEIPNDVYRNEGRSLAMLGRMSEARMVFTDQTRAYPEDAEAWRDLATSAVASNDLPRAEQAAERLVALLSSDAAGYTLRGIVAERNGRFDEAVRWHRLAVVRAPKSIESLVALGLALQYAGKSKEGLEIMAEALKLDPNSSIARRAFAVAEAE